METVKKFDIFQYDSKDFNFIVQQNHQDANDSKFDRILKEKYEEGMKNNIFRYKLNISESKILDGQYRFFAQLNVERGSNRRAPEDIQSMNTPFDPSRFNFTKISDKEIYFDICVGDGNNVVAANVSPVEYGHCLFLPERLKCLPQQATKFSIIKVIELFLLSKSPYLRAAYNSLCAYASVNHLHWHLYYLNIPMLLEKYPLECLSEPLYLLENYPAKGFCIKQSSFLDNDYLSFASAVYLFVKYLQEQLIPHNVYITRAKKSRESISYDDIRVYIWARKPNFGIKNTLGFLPAVNEFSGHLSIKTKEAYESLTEDMVAQCMEDVTNDFFLKLKKNLEDKNNIFDGS
ncbi:GDP-D-glucose phosphorylase 1 [Chelonus insularis]|uniref:GDP-D-glucose phosphorylase 1 n=1 Tax=Chelonus insularis TaxID=460826 RepID=UPI00158B7CDA|nr:GDP-D-glucose phosphorylase 1 [Chelonus insularis]